MFLSFNWQSNRLWYIVLFAVCFDIRYFFNFYLEDEPILSLIKAILMFLGEMACGILELIVQYRSRRKRQSKKKNDDIINIKPNS